MRTDAQDRPHFSSYADSILPVQDYTARPTHEPRQQEVFTDQPRISGFVPIRESETPGMISPPTGPNSEHGDGGDTVPPTGFMPAEESHHKTRSFGAILPSIDDLKTEIEFSGNQGDQRNSPSPSPLTDMKDIRRALPDP